MGRKANTRTSPATWQRFDAKVLLIPFSDCHYWTGTTGHFGYGVFKLDGRHERAHRAAYERHNGQIPAGMLVRHKCDQPLCVNPDHLLTGTQSDNMRDAADRKRMPLGEKHWIAKLSDAQVDELKERALAGEQTGDLAAHFGVSRALVSSIRHGNAAHTSRAAGVIKPTGRTDRRVSDDTARDMYSRAHAGERVIDIAHRHGVKKSFIYDVKRGATYASVTGHRS